MIATVLALAGECSPAQSAQAHAGWSNGNGPAWSLNEAVCRPDLKVDGRDRRTGTAFLLQPDVQAPRRVLVMAQHLFGMRGAEEIPWWEMPGRATSASCRSIGDDRIWHAGAALMINGAHAMGPLASLKDIAVMPVLAKGVNDGGRQVRALRLAPAPPHPGEKVWLIAPLLDPSHAAEHVHAAIVVPAEGFLAFVYQDPDRDFSNTSGAPIVNGDGEVVGVNVAVAHYEGATIGIADNLATLRAAVSGDSRPRDPS